MRIASFDNRYSLSRGRTHLSFQLGGKRIRYAYIRKNGCSAFKSAMGFDYRSKLSLIRRHHRVSPFAKYDATIFVWRDPEDRIISLYRNKIIDGVEGDELYIRFRAFAAPHELTFERFVAFCVMGGDPHCIPQSTHLKPLFYTHAIPLHRLHEAMVEIVGGEAAGPFEIAINSSKPTPVVVSDWARHTIRHHYACDYKLIAGLQEEAL